MPEVTRPATKTRCSTQKLKLSVTTAHLLTSATEHAEEQSQLQTQLTRSARAAQASYLREEVYLGRPPSYMRTSLHTGHQACMSTAVASHGPFVLEGAIRLGFSWLQWLATSSRSSSPLLATTSVATNGFSTGRQARMVGETLQQASFTEVTCKLGHETCTFHASKALSIHLQSVYLHPCSL